MDSSIVFQVLDYVVDIANPNPYPPKLGPHRTFTRLSKPSILTPLTHCHDMPRHVIARNSGVHRIAAIALYRALLTQCRLLPTTQPVRDDARNIIRNRFRQVTHLGSARRLKVAFQAGYEAIDKLDAAVAGDGESTQYIEDLVSRAPDRIKQPWTTLHPSSQSAPKFPKSVEQAEETTVRRKVELGERPLPLAKLSGKRHVPKLVNANHIPILRFKKPQPENLSGYINKQVKRRQQRHDRRHDLEDDIALARFEDQWEGIVGTRMEGEGLKSESDTESVSGGRGQGKQSDMGFEGPVRRAMRETQGALNAERNKNREWGRKLQGIVDAEQALYDKEEKDRKQVAADRRYLKWCQRKSVEPRATGTALAGRASGAVDAPAAPG